MIEILTNVQVRDAADIILSVIPEWRVSDEFMAVIITEEKRVLIYPRGIVPTAEQIELCRVALQAVGAWTLSADGTDGASDITVSGADAACVWSVEFGGEVIASETDASAPYAVTLAAPVAAGTYIIRAVATDGTKTGELEIEVV